MSDKEVEVEELRTLLRRAGGIGTERDEWTPYTGPGEEAIIRRAVADYLVDVEQSAEHERTR